MTLRPCLLLAFFLLLATCVSAFEAEPTDSILFDLVDSAEDLFSMDELKKSAYYSSISRCLTYNTKSISNWTCKTCKTKVPQLTDVIVGEAKPSEIPYYVGYSKQDDQIVVNARSSTTIENWLYNLDFKTSDYPCAGCQVHTGFYKSYKELRDSLLSAYHTLSSKHNTLSIRITGHSLAAAIATHAALDVASGTFTRVDLAGMTLWHSTTHNGYNTMTDEQFTSFAKVAQTQNGRVEAGIKFKLVTPFFNFGSPRVGNQAWVREFQRLAGTRSLIRSTHANDPVCRVPMRDTLGYHYQHTSQEIYFPSASNSFKVCNDAVDEAKECAIGNLLPVIITDHLFYAGIAMMQNPLDCT